MRQRREIDIPATIPTLIPKQVKQPEIVKIQVEARPAEVSVDVQSVERPVMSSILPVQTGIPVMEVSIEGIQLSGISAVEDINLVCGCTDMRKSIDGLRAIAEGALPLDSKSRSLFLFCRCRCDQMKALLWEGDGYVLMYKCLAVQGRYRWPRCSGEARNITRQEFDWLMTGIDIEQPTAVKVRRVE